MKKLLLLGVLLAAAYAAQAIPTIIGPTGGFEVPTTDIANGIQIAVDQPTSPPTPATVQKFPNTRFLNGIDKNLEVGALFQEFTFIGPTTITNWNLNAKYALQTGDSSIKYAIGAYYGQPIQASTLHEWEGYLAASTTVATDLKLTANLGYGWDENDNGLAFAVAAEKPVSEKTNFGGEFVVGNNLGVNTHANFYLTREIDPSFIARIAFNGIGDATQITLGATYTFKQ